MEIEFQGQYDWPAYRRAVYLALRPAGREAALRIGGALLVLVIFVAALVLAFLREDPSNRDLVQTGRYLIVLPFLEYALLLPYFRMYATARNAWSDPDVRGPRRGCVSGQGITLVGRSGSLPIDWSRVARLRHSDDLLIALTVDGRLVVLSKGFFQRESDWQAVRGWALSKVVEVT